MNSAPRDINAYAKSSFVRVPIAFKIRYQRRAEMAKSLFARIDRHVAAKYIKRLFRDAKCATIAGGADHARTGEIVHDPLQRAVDFRGSGDLIADQASSRRVAVEPAAIEDRLARYPIAREAPQPKVCGARNDALLARR